MNVFDFAMKMEEDGKAYYEKMAAQTELAGLRNIFERLAADEQKHYDIFRDLKAGSKVPAMPATTVLDEARNVFAELPKGETVVQKVASDLAAYKHAMKLEAESFRLYEEAAAKESDPKVKALLEKIAVEEHKHFEVLDNIYHFINAPNQYLAWGEFSNIGEFHQFGRDVDR